MSEIPELPPRTPLSRPVPAGGLERAVTAGRRRRNRFVGAAGGVTTALVLVVAAGVLSPAPSNDSLQFADPTPSPAPSQRPEGAQAPPDSTPQEDPAAASASPSPEASEAPEQSSPTRQPEPEAQADPDPDQQDGPPTRQAYLEQPRDVAAPMACQAAPSQPVITAGSSCPGRTTTTSRAVQGGQASAVLSYCVNYGEDDYVLRYDSGREHEVRVYRGEGGPLLYTFSETVRYEQGAHARRIPGGRCLEWTAVWDITLADGSDAPAGEYWMMATLEPDGVNDWPEGGDYGGGVGFRVTVTED